MRYDRKHTIILQNKVSEQNPLGSRNESFVDVSTFRAAYVPNTGRMYLGGSSVHTETDCEFQMVYSLAGPVIQPDMYVFHVNTGVRYLIQTVLDVGGQHRDLRILCKREK